MMEKRRKLILILIRFNLFGGLAGIISLVTASCIADYPQQSFANRETIARSFSFFLSYNKVTFAFTLFVLLVIIGILLWLYEWKTANDKV